MTIALAIGGIVALIHGVFTHFRHGINWPKVKTFVVKYAQYLGLIGLAAVVGEIAADLAGVPDSNLSWAGQWAPVVIAVAGVVQREATQVTAELSAEASKVDPLK